MRHHLISLIAIVASAVSFHSFAIGDDVRAAERVSRVLDALHDAASKADGERYFALFAPDAVFLGTDATERWSLDEFRSYAMKRFETGTGWTYTLKPGSRHIAFDDGEQLAWFDELLENTKYGECRGTGVLQKLDGDWKIAQYHLTIPIPNEIALDVVRMIRHEPAPATTVVVVRHAPRINVPGATDPPLSEEGVRQAQVLAQTLASVSVDALYISQFQRTQQTVRPIAERLALDPQIIDARDTKALVDQIRREHAGKTVLVCGHSNTIPDLLERLGIENEISIEESDFDDLFIVTFDNRIGAQMLHLHYGE